MVRLPCRVSRDPLKRELLDVFPTTSFEVSKLGNPEAMRVIFFWKSLEFRADLKNAGKNVEKMFCFWDKCIWTVCIDLSLLIRECLSSAVNVLTKILKTFHVTKGNFFNSITFKVINQYDKGAGVKIKSVFWRVYNVACRGVPSNGSFEIFIQPRLSRSVSSVIQKLWGSFFLKIIEI